jgi:small-conductance mechanosensitive channel
MLDRFSTNLTQVTGLLSFAATTIACLLAARRSESRDAPTWRLLAFINCLLLIETISGLRYQIHNLVKEKLESEGLYTQMHGWIQELINISIAIIALIFVTLFLFRRQVGGGAARVAVSMTIVVVALFAIETVSLHELRPVIYQPIGPVLMIGWLWAIAAAGICLAATQR